MKTFCTSCVIIVNRKYEMNKLVQNMYIIYVIFIMQVNSNQEAIHILVKFYDSSCNTFYVRNASFLS